MLEPSEVVAEDADDDDADDAVSHPSSPCISSVHVSYPLLVADESVDGSVRAVSSPLPPPSPDDDDVSVPVSVP